MLSAPDFRILSHMLDQNNVVFSDDIPEFFTEVRMDHLENLGYVQRISYPSGRFFYRLLPAGEDALSEEQKRRDQESDQKRQLLADAIQERHNKKKSFCRDLLVGILGGLVVLAVEHRHEFNDFLRVTIYRIWSMLH